MHVYDVREEMQLRQVAEVAFRNANLATRSIQQRNVISACRRVSRALYIRLHIMGSEILWALRDLWEETGRKCSGMKETPRDSWCVSVRTLVKQMLYKASTSICTAVVITTLLYHWSKLSAHPRQHVFQGLLDNGYVNPSTRNPSQNKPSCVSYYGIILRPPKTFTCNEGM